MTTESFVPSIDEPRGGESPLNDFWGVLKQWEAEDRVFEGAKYPTRDIHFHFVDLEVIASEEPYPFPVAEIIVRYADPARSRGQNKWDHFASSLRPLFGKDPSAMNKLVGRRQHWIRTSGTTRVQEDGEWVNKPAMLWTVAEVDGVTAPTNNGAGGGARELALDLADGKTEGEFYTAALSNQTIMRDAVLVDSLTSRSFVKQMIDLGPLTQDEAGLLHKKA